MKHITRIASALFLATSLVSAAAPADEAAKKRILFVLTSHDKKGDTGKPTGFFLSEVTHPHHVLT
ncbi:MAG: type 1 glutamine amidotransferase domain-containing protein, partial [Luteolibacter sp.]